MLIPVPNDISKVRVRVLFQRLASFAAVQCLLAEGEALQTQRRHDHKL